MLLIISNVVKQDEINENLEQVSIKEKKQQEVWNDWDDPNDDNNNDWDDQNNDNNNDGWDNNDNDSWNDDWDKSNKSLNGCLLKK